MFLIVATASCLLLYAKRNNPVLLDLKTDVRDDHGFQVLNPFRSKQAEFSAEAFLGELKRGNCESTLRQLGEDSQGLEYVCSREQKYPIVKWKLEAIGRDQDRLVLRYRVRRRADREEFGDPFWIWLTEKNGQWHVSGTEAWY
jgi:hypothetical protein